jgi:glycosyltransferase involved in cell wall biosynthesis
MLSSRVSTRRSGTALYRAPMPDQLRVAILGSGRSLHTKRWARRLAERGHEVHIYTVFPEPVEGVHVHDVLGRRLPKGTGVRKLWRRRHLRRELADLDPDIVQTQNLWPSGEWAWRAGKRPVVQGVWGSDVLVIPKTDPSKRKLAQTLLREADAITVNSDGLKRGVTDLDVPAELVHRIGWGVDTRVRYTGERDRSLIDTIFPGRPVVASPRLHKQLYNLDVIMATIPLVQREVPDAAFLFMAYGVETEALRRQAEELGVTDSVHFRRFTEDEVPLVFAGSELTVSVPASDTGRPTSLLEAMAARLPIVLADLPAIHELIDQGDGAEIVPLRDVGATAAAIVRLLNDEGLRRRYGDRNREVVVREADATVETDRCIELYRRLISS